MRPTPPVVGWESLCEGGMLPVLPDDVPLPLAEVPLPVEPELGQSARPDAC